MKTINKIKSLTLFFVVPFLLTSNLFITNSLYADGDADVVPANFLKIDEDPNKKIAELNKEILQKRLPEVEYIAGELYADSKPTTFVGDFANQGSKILNLIGILYMVQNRKFLRCRNCLNAINDIFFQQFYEFIMKLPIDEQVKKESVRIDLKTSLLETLFRIYRFKNIKSNGIGYAYDTVPLGLIFTAAIVNIFKTLDKKNWSYEKKKNVLSQRLDETKESIFVVLQESSTSSIAFSGKPSFSEVSDLIDSLKIIILKKKKPTNWGKILKWTAIGTVVVAGVVGLVLIAKAIKDKMQNGNNITVSPVEISPKQFEEIKKAASNLNLKKMDLKHDWQGLKDGFKKVGEKINENQEKGGILGKSYQGLCSEVDRMLKGPKGPFTKGVDKVTGVVGDVNGRKQEGTGDKETDEEERDDQGDSDDSEADFFVI